MLRFIVRRILETIPVLLIVATITFFMVRLAPGNPFDTERAITPEARKNLEAFYGRDKPMVQQYLIYMKKLVTHGDFGPSMRYPNRTVNDLIGESFPVSLELGLYSISIALFFGLILGVVAALKPNSPTDYTAMSLAMVGICLPTFVIGPLLILVFALILGWFNASGWFFPSDRFLPALTMGGIYAAYVARLSRGGMLEILNQDFIRTARAKGASEKRVILKHALKGGLLPVISFLGPAVAGLVTGSFVVERIFQIPGLGQYFVTAAFNRDDGMIMGTVIFYATLIVTLNLIVDVVQVWLNPKLKFD